jgi:hypothetical protein
VPPTNDVAGPGDHADPGSRGASAGLLDTSPPPMTCAIGQLYIDVDINRGPVLAPTPWRRDWCLAVQSVKLLT